MRQNMEELQATQEQQERQERDLRAELELVENEKVKLEKQLKAKEEELKKVLG